MANWSNPTVTSLYTDFVTEVKDRDLDVAKGMDPAIVTVTSPVANMIRWNSANGYWEKYNGASWAALASSYAIQVGAFTGDVTKSAGASALTIAADVVSDAKLRNSSALSVIGRSANSSGDPADIVASAGSAAVLRESGNVLGFGTIATAGIANDAVTFAKMQNINTDRVIGRFTGGAGDPEEITVTAAGRALIDDADAATQRSTLGLGTLATQNGTFSGTSSGTNTGDQKISTLSSYFESSEQAVTVGSNNSITVAHGLGTVPKMITISLRCKITEHGYGVGDEITFMSIYSNANWTMNLGANSTNVFAIIPGTPSNPVITDTSYAPAIPTAANWRWVLRAWA